MGHCHRCEIIMPDHWLTICYAADDMRIIGILCDDCVYAWLEYERMMEEQE